MHLESNKAGKKQQKKWIQTWRGAELGLSPDGPTTDIIGHKTDASPPMWCDVRNVVKHERASSAPGRNGAPYRANKIEPDLLRFPWRKQLIPRTWHRAGGTATPREELNK